MAFHPLYTLCPKWSENKSLEESRESFITNSGLDDGNGQGFWSDNVKLTGEGHFAKCYSFQQPNPVHLGIHTAVVKFVINMTFVDELTMAIHVDHGYIDTHYSVRGTNRLKFPSQTLGGNVVREMRYEIT